MQFDLETMTRKDLEDLGRDVTIALENLRKQDVKKVRAEMEKLAAANNLTLEEVLGGKAARKSGPKTKSAPKFANPANASQTWTGKGRQPEWFKSAVSGGTDPDSMAI
ncbi:H-NS histone family protein [Octadecabacter sp. 1_MG-2023]|uniref:H-NS histone family protein n=1 Tax=unclassified Octadecabacter TaxID=196158 RepID=UPI001C094526|nr:MULTISPECIES: H-NS histone family protein [unclassified Octadecabacter]MBU2991790.1 H-NS histone family protein [Octadecabacter sp. B2R22]MDO6735763.1 H-NS histone family protein [Octadecabacter sp. 1_MG-2023]